MKRDLDLVRAILLRAEWADGEPLAMAIPGADPRTVAHHVELLQEAGLLVAALERDGKGILAGAQVERLTWRGHDFLDAARNEGIWRALRQSLDRRGVTVPFDMLEAMLREETRAYLEMFEG